MTAGVSLRVRLGMVLRQQHANKKQHIFDELVLEWATGNSHGLWSME